MIKHITLSIGLFFWGITCLSCEEYPLMETKTVYINHYYGTAIGVREQLTYLIKEEGDTDWSYFYNTIANFDYQPGYMYKLTVDVYPISNPPADSPSKRYVLNTINSKTAIDSDTSFEIILIRNEFTWITISSDDEEKISLMGIVPVTFENPGLKSDFLNVYAENSPGIVYGSFQHAAAGNRIIMTGFCQEAH